MTELLKPTIGLFIITALSVATSYWDSLLRGFPIAFFTVVAGYFGYWMACVDKEN